MQWQRRLWVIAAEREREWEKRDTLINRVVERLKYEHRKCNAEIRYSFIAPNINVFPFSFLYSLFRLRVSERLTMLSTWMLCILPCLFGFAIICFDCNAFGVCFDTFMHLSSLVNSPSVISLLCAASFEFLLYLIFLIQFLWFSFLFVLCSIDGSSLDLVCFWAECVRLFSFYFSKKATTTTTKSVVYT